MNIALSWAADMDFQVNEMACFPTYDPQTDSVRLNGSATIMLTLLMKAKFGERFDPETLFHPLLSELIDQLQAAAGLPLPQVGECFDRQDLWLFSKRVLEKSVNLGWWKMNGVEREAFLQQAAAPWRLSPEQIETIRDDVAGQLLHQRQRVAAADAAGEPGRS